MKIYRYWVTEKQKILIDGVEQDITCYGGSNISEEDARLRAKEKAEKVQRIVLGKEFDAQAMTLNSRDGWRTMKERAGTIVSVDSSNRWAQDTMWMK